MRILLREREREREGDRVSERKTERDRSGGKDIATQVGLNDLAWLLLSVQRTDLLPCDSRTRGAAEDLRRPISTVCLAASYMAATWNPSAVVLRKATTLSEAKLAAKRLAKEVRHAYTCAVNL